MPKVIVKKVVKKTILVKKKRKAPDDGTDPDVAQSPAKVVKVAADPPATTPAVPVEPPAPAPVPHHPVDVPSQEQKPAGKGVRLVDRPGAPRKPSPRHQQQPAATAPSEPRQAACFVQAVCDAQALLLHLVQAVIDGVRLLRIRHGNQGLILHLSSSGAALDASRKGKVDIEGVPLAVKSRHTPKQLFLNGDVFAVCRSVLSRTVGELTGVEWSTGFKEATLAFAKQEDADRALAQGTFDVAPGLQIEIRQSHAQARLFLDLPKLFHLAATQALPGLVRLTWSPTMESALATFWGSDHAKKLLKEGTVEILGRPCKVTTRKAKFVGFTGEYD